jgi:hypothetical protein
MYYMFMEGANKPMSQCFLLIFFYMLTTIAQYLKKSVQSLYLSISGA